MTGDPPPSAPEPKTSAPYREGREPLPDHAGESPLLSRSGGAHLQGRMMRMCSVVSDSVTPWNLGVLLESDWCVEELLRAHQGCQYRFALQDGTWDFS